MENLGGHDITAQINLPQQGKGNEQGKSHINA